jgi:hypothetical protein
MSKTTRVVSVRITINRDFREHASVLSNCFAGEDVEETEASANDMARESIQRRTLHRLLTRSNGLDQPSRPTAHVNRLLACPAETQEDFRLLFSFMCLKAQLSCMSTHSNVGERGAEGWFWTLDGQQTKPSHTKTAT